MNETVKVEELLDLSHTIAAELFEGLEYPWEALGGIKDFILRLGPTLDKELYTQLSEGVWAAKDAKIAPSAYLGAPCIIDSGAEIRHCAFIRGSAIVGKNAVVGNSVELKNVVLFDNVQTPHYNYVGDSVLGYKAHMGAGSITSNVKSDKSLVVERVTMSLWRPVARNSAPYLATLSRWAATAFSIPEQLSAAAAMSIPPPAFAVLCPKAASGKPAG